MRPSCKKPDNVRDSNPVERRQGGSYEAKQTVVPFSNAIGCGEAAGHPVSGLFSCGVSCDAAPSVQSLGSSATSRLAGRRRKPFHQQYETLLRTLCHAVPSWKNLKIINYNNRLRFSCWSQDGSIGPRKRGIPCRKHGNPCRGPLGLGVFRGTFNRLRKNS